MLVRLYLVIQRALSVSAVCLLVPVAAWAAESSVTADQTAVVASNTALATEAQFNDSEKRSEKIENTKQGVWVVDTGNCRVEKFDSKGNYLSQFGSCGSGHGQFNLPTAIAIDGRGNLWVVDTLNNRVQRFDNNGTYLSQFGAFGTGNGQFNGPLDIAIDRAENLWVVDSDNGRVQEFDRSGVYLSQFGSTGTRKGQFYQPQGLAIENNDDIWVGDRGRVQK